jgi:hypothetical protein
MATKTHFHVSHKPTDFAEIQYGRLSIFPFLSRISKNAVDNAYTE